MLNNLMQLSWLASRTSLELLKELTKNQEVGRRP